MFSGDPQDQQHEEDDHQDGDEQADGGVHDAKVPEILALDPARRTNGQLIADCARLGYLRETDRVLDVTYRNGLFWTKWRPLALFTNDLDPNYGELHDDWRKLHWDDGWFDVVVLDPDYKLNGTGGSHASDERFGVDTPYEPMKALYQRIVEGIAECARVCKPRGYVLVKCMDQVSSGRKQWMTIELALEANLVGLPLVDQLHVFGYRSQPAGRRQVHSRSSFSTLNVHRKGK